MSDPHLQPYPFPDLRLLDHPDLTPWLIWQPDHLCIVIGRGNNAESSVHCERAQADGVPIYQRPSGGEAVLLSPATLAISAVIRQGLTGSSQHFFRHFNTAVREALGSAGIDRPGCRGISDLSLGNRKILGSSMYRNRKLVFYHAVLNVAESGERIERYLRHPGREPDYRQGRPHRDFVTSLHQAGFAVSLQNIREALEHRFSCLVFPTE